MRSKINLSFSEAAKEIPQLAGYLSVEPLRGYDGKIIDPWNESELSENDKDNIIRKCREDIWYFIRYVLKVNGINHKLFDFHLNAASAAFIYLFQNNQNAILLGMRQSTQKTVLLEALYTWTVLIDESKHSCILPLENIKDLFVTVPEFICHMENFPKINNDDNHIITNDDRCFIDDLMYIPKTPFNQPYNSCYAVGTIGPYNVDIIQKTIPFNESMYEKDLKEFENIFTSFTGYRPTYLILLGIDDIDDCSVNKWKKQFRENLGKGESYRKEIQIKPYWRM